MNKSTFAKTFAVLALGVSRIIAQQPPAQPQVIPPRIIPLPPGMQLPQQGQPGVQTFNFSIPVPAAVCEATVKQIADTEAAKTAITTDLAKLMTLRAHDVTARYENPTTPDKAPLYQQAFAELNIQLVQLGGLITQQQATLAACLVTRA